MHCFPSLIHFSSLFAFPKDAKTVLRAEARLAAVVFGDVIEAVEPPEEWPD